MPAAAAAAGAAVGIGPTLVGPMGVSCVMCLPSAVVRPTGLAHVVRKPGGRARSPETAEAAPGAA